jgi:hypothetical protein
MLQPFLKLADARIYPHDFSKCEKIRSSDRELVESSFFNLAKKTRLGAGFAKPFPKNQDWEWVLETLRDALRTHLGTFLECRNFVGCS